MTKIWYDTEFLENGSTIELISIGMVREDGAEYYAVSRDATTGKMVRKIRRHEWLMTNVVPHLPRPHGDWILHMPQRWLFDYHSPLVKDRGRIAEEVRAFILDVPDPELWAWCGAYDHVALCQLFGRMVDLPDGVPMWTNDLRQEVRRLGDPQMPEQAAGECNALADARYLTTMARHLDHLNSFKVGMVQA